MTYCVALYLRDGIVCLSDTRTNAGVDHIATYAKTFTVEEPGTRALVLMTAGNLATTQAVVGEVVDGRAFEGGAGRTLKQAETMTAAAEIVGAAVRRVHDRVAESLEAADGRFDATFILGGQIKDGPMRVFQIYTAGNFVEASEETPFLQIGEHKYGKPILDRAMRHDLAIADGAKLALVSLDSTLRSNLSVGLPADLTIIKRDAHKIETHRRITEDDAYFVQLRKSWSDALRAALAETPGAPWLSGDDQSAPRDTNAQTD